MSDETDEDGIRVIEHTAEMCIRDSFAPLR